jgi:hypothetical protein
MVAVNFIRRLYILVWQRLQIYRNAFPTVTLCLTPVLAAAIFIYTLTTLASFDVVNSFIYILFYLIIGIACLCSCMFLLFVFFDLSWIDDVLNMQNPAAALAVAGGGLGTALIYAGSNVGDGPGWWCVFVAGGLGIIAWFILGIIVNIITKVFKQITIGRDIFCGIRTFSYLISSGIIIGRASAGDWTSFSKTIEEFGDGWPVLFLSALFIIIELLLVNISYNNRQNEIKNDLSKYAISLLLGAVYLAIAIFAVYFLPPLPVNPIYQLARVYG